MLIETKYNLQQIVYLKTDLDQQKRMVIGISIKPRGVLYELAFGSFTSWHYEMEIWHEINQLVKAGV